MKYANLQNPVPQEQRKKLNEKILYLIDSNTADENGITAEDIYQAYTGDGGLHGLNREDYDNYHDYSEAKKEIENGQFFTSHILCELMVSCLKLSEHDLVADLTCGMGNFFNFMPTENNVYGCEKDIKAYKVARYLYPDANLEWTDIRTYQPGIRFDYVVGNPPFHLDWWIEDVGKAPSQMYYCQKAAELLKPLGIMVLIVPMSFLADSFTNGGQIKEMESRFSFLGQIRLPDDSFSAMGVPVFPTKLQFWQKRSNLEGFKPHPYCTDMDYTITSAFSVETETERAYEQFIRYAKSTLEQNSFRLLLELGKQHTSSGDFQYQVQKLLYQIKVHPRTKERYAKCCEYLHTFYTQKQPEDMSYEKWCQVRLTEAKVLSYLQRALKKQNQKPEQHKTSLVKQNDQFVYKAYSAATKRQLAKEQRIPVPIYQAVLDNHPEQYPGYERLLRKKRVQYENQNQPFSEMKEAAEIAGWLEQFRLWDSENEEEIRLNDKQKSDLNLILQKRYALLQWEQGSGKTLAGIATGKYRMESQHLHSTWVISSAISIRNNWDVVLKNYGISYVFVEKLADLERIRPGDFVLLTLNKVCQYKRQLVKWMKRLHQKVQLVLDESDEISNAGSQRCKAVLACFRRCHAKLLTTGTSTRNNIVEFAPQLELLYNNSVNMISWNRLIYKHNSRDEKDAEADAELNPYYGQPIPAYKKGYSLFSASHLPERITVFAVDQLTQDLYNADVLNDLLAKTVITRTFEEVVGKQIKRIHQVPIRFAPQEREVYQLAMDEFYRMRSNYFASTGNSRKDSMMKLIQQIVLLLRVSAAPDTLVEYQSDIPVKALTAVEMIAQWPDEIVAVGVRHKVVLESFERAFREYLPERPLFIVTGSNTTFAKRRQLRQTLKESGNGILLCTQQSLPSSVNFEYVNKVIIPELHYNNAGMSQFYFRFIRYTSTEYKDIYFLTYVESLESNLMHMILAKEKINLFMKGQDIDLDAIYEKFDINYDLLSLMLQKEKDAEGRLQLRWGKQLIA